VQHIAHHRITLQRKENLSLISNNLQSTSVCAQNHTPASISNRYHHPEVSTIFSSYSIQNPRSSIQKKKKICILSHSRPIHSSNMYSLIFSPSNLKESNKELFCWDGTASCINFGFLFVLYPLGSRLKINFIRLTNMHVTVIILSQKRGSHTLMTQMGMSGKLRLPDHEKKTVCLITYYLHSWNLYTNKE